MSRCEAQFTGSSETNRSIYGNSFYLDCAVEEVSNESSIVYDIKCWKLGDEILLIVDNGHRVSAYGTNSDYSFFIQRNSEEGAWVLKDFGSDDVFEDMTPGFMSNIFFGQYIEMTPISEVGKLETSVDVGTQDRVVSFSIASLASNGDRRHLASGRAWLMDGESLVDRFEASIVSPVDTATVRGRCSYKQASDSEGYVPVSRTMEYFTGGSDQPDLSIISKITLFDRRAIEPSRFRLTSFGIPEPALNRGIGGWRIVLAVGALSLVVLASWKSRKST